MKNIFKLTIISVTTIIFVVSLIIVGFRMYSEAHDKTLAYKQFNKDFGIDISHDTKIVYLKEHISIDPAIEGVVQINYKIYNRIIRLPQEGKCEVDRNLEPFKDKTDRDILKQMYSNDFLKKFPISLKDFKFCLYSKDSFSIWRIFKYNKKYYLYFFLR